MTLAAIAAELGIGETTVRRVLEAALAKLLAGAEEHDLDPIFFSTVIVTFLGGERRKSEIRAEAERMPRVSPPASSLAPGETRHAGRLPRRFGRNT